MPDSSNNAGSPLRRAARIALVIGWSIGIYVASDTPNLRVSNDDMLDLILRKAAHLAVYAVLAVLVARAWRPEHAHHARVLAIAWIITLGWAISDEWHQTFVRGRVGHASDVAIDMIGATLGLLAARLAAPRLMHRKGHAT